jgi:hypothetical protein
LTVPLAGTNIKQVAKLAEGVANLGYPNQELPWDGQKMEVTNSPEANAYVRRNDREGWTL